MHPCNFDVTLTAHPNKEFWSQTFPAPPSGPRQKCINQSHLHTL